jgi:PEP-CTERM motif
MNTIYKFGVAIAALSFTPQAIAAVVLTASSPGQMFQVSYSGQVNGSPAPAISALQDFTFTGVSNSGLTYNFNQRTENTSTVSSKLRSFGFDITSPGSLSGASATGALPNVSFGSNFPEDQGTRDICFRANSTGNCTGGPGGITPGFAEAGLGSFSLTFGSALTSIRLDNFITRFQAIDPSQNGGDSGVGLPVTAPVPEPASWALMIVGFGIAGSALRRRQAERLLVLA